MGEGTPRISDAEWDVMEVVWELGSVTPAEVIDRVAGRRGWNHRTVRTLLSRLVEKRALRREGAGARSVYQAAVSRRRCVRGAGPILLEQSLRRGRRLAADPFRPGGEVRPGRPRAAQETPRRVDRGDRAMMTFLAFLDRAVSLRWRATRQAAVLIALILVARAILGRGSRPARRLRDWAAFTVNPIPSCRLTGK